MDLRSEHRIKIMITGGLGHIGAHVIRKISIHFSWSRSANRRQHRDAAILIAF